MSGLWARLLVLALACALQFHQLGRDLRFHPDEAYFMTFARRAAVNGEWTLPGPLDKPPLTVYVGALSMTAIGVVADADGVLHLDALVGEFAARVPNVMLGILLVAVMMRLAWRRFDKAPSALLAGLLTALSPYVTAYGASAFTDMGLIFWAAVALLGLETGTYARAGLALGLAFFCKQQALFLLPLVVLLLWTRRAERSSILRLFAAFGALSLLLLLWDAWRPETSVFVLGAVNNAPNHWLAEAGEWPGRLLEWLRMGLWLLGPPLVTVALIALALIARPGKDGGTGVYALYIMAYIAAHAIFPFNHYERYLLLILPMMLLVAAGRVSPIFFGMRYGRRVALSLLCLMTILALWSTWAGPPIGGDRARQDGIDEVARYLNSRPVAAVIYDPWLGWELGYYLGQWSDKRRVHYPTAEALVAGALALDEKGPRYFVAPTDEAYGDWLAALERAGFGVSLEYARGRFAVYRLSPSGA